MKKILVLSILLFSITQSVKAQKYINPLDFRLQLSGTFGELRSNHFHAGIDLKTKGVEGQKVYAIADGYVSRIKSSSYGYGKAIYITHYDGKTSVYAHLQKFSIKIDTIIKKQQYKRERFDINVFLKKDSIKVKQGEIIALSGNSGSSGGAHLHFEIRDTETEHPLNPLDYGFQVLDKIPPLLKQIKIFDLADGKSEIYEIKKLNNKYIIKDTISVNNKIGIGIYTFDQSNDAYNKNGVNKIRLYIDSNLIYNFELDRLDFSTNKYINSHIDYEEKVNSKRKFHRCYRLPNNPLKNYKTLINNGHINIEENKIYDVILEVSDSYNNLSILNFKLKYEKNISAIKVDSITKEKSQKFYWYKKNEFSDKNFRISINKNYLYETIDFKYLEKDSVSGTFSNIHQCHYDIIPLHKAAKISIRANVPSYLKDKVYIAKLKNDNYYYFGGKWENNFLTAKTGEFGDFAVVADTINPTIKGVNLYPGKTIKKQRTIKYIIDDKESGIKKFTASLNGKWILMEYDHKRKLIKYDFNDLIVKGENIFILEVEDMVGNLKNYKAKFNY